MYTEEVYSQVQLDRDKKHEKTLRPGKRTWPHGILEKIIKKAMTISKQRRNRWNFKKMLQKKNINIKQHQTKTKKAAIHPVKMVSVRPIIGITDTHTDNRYRYRFDKPISVSVLVRYESKQNNRYWYWNGGYRYLFRINSNRIISIGIGLI